MKNNFDEQAPLLKKHLQAEHFRFVIVQYNHYSLIKQLKDYVLQHYPNRKTATVKVADTDYRQLLDTLYQYEKGIVFMDDFRYIFDNEPLCTGLNQRRDKLASLSIAIIIFLPAEKKYVIDCTRKLPDLWSFRSLMLNLEAEVEPTNIENQHFDTVKNNSSIGGNTAEEKEAELARLQQRLAEIAETEENISLLTTIYPQVFELLMDLGRYNEGLKLTEKFYQIFTKFDLTDKEISLYLNILDFKGRFLFYQGNYSDAQNIFVQALKISIQNRGEECESTALMYNNIAETYKFVGNYEKALEYNLKALTIREKVLSPDHPDLATSYNNIAETYYYLKEYKTAKMYIDKAVAIRVKVLPEGHPYIKSSKETQKKINAALEGQGSSIFNTSV